MGEAFPRKITGIILHPPGNKVAILSA